MPSPPNANNFYLILKGGWKKKKKKGDIFATEECSCCSFYNLFNMEKRPYNQ